MALVLREKDVRLLLSMPDTVEVLEQAFAALAQNNALNRPRTRLVLANGVLHMLSAAAPSLGVLGFKAYTTFREGVRCVVMLFSAQNDTAYTFAKGSICLKTEHAKAGSGSRKHMQHPVGQHEARARTIQGVILRQRCKRLFQHLYRIGHAQ